MERKVKDTSPHDRETIKRVGSICRLSVGACREESKGHKERVGPLLPAWFEVNLVGLEGEKAVDRAREVKEVPVETTRRTRRTFEIRNLANP
jgi:hypothetical protein